MIDIVGAMAKLKVKDVDRDNLHQGCIRLALFLVLGDDSRCAVKYPLQVIKFTIKLQFNNDKLVLAVFNLEINTVGFVAFTLFVACTLQNFKNTNVFAQQLA